MAQQNIGKFWAKPPTKRIKAKFTVNDATPKPARTMTNNTSETFEKDPVTIQPAGNSVPSYRTSPNQDRRILREMLQKQSKATVDAINNLAISIVKKIYTITTPQEPTIWQNQAASPSSNNMTNPDEPSIMDEIDNTDNKTQTERMNKLREHKRTYLPPA